MTSKTAAVGEEISQAYGVVRVATEVIAWIAGQAALEADGVRGLVRPRQEGSDKLLRSSQIHKGVSVQMESDHTVVIDVWIVLDSGKNAPTVGKHVQQNIADMVERMLNLRVLEVNVYVTHVAFS